jgi:hypothetical protein
MLNANRDLAVLPMPTLRPKYMLLMPISTVECPLPLALDQDLTFSGSKRQLDRMIKAAVIKSGLTKWLPEVVAPIETQALQEVSLLISSLQLLKSNNNSQLIFTNNFQ